MTKSKKAELKSIHIGNVNTVLMVISFVLCCGVFFSTIKTKRCSSSMAESMNDYAECNKAVNTFREASDFLTDQVRLFSINLDPVNMNLYFEELEIVQRREKALEILQLSHENDDVESYMKRAIDASMRLEESEFYTFRLVCEGLNYAEEDMPEQIRNIVLSDAHKASSSQRKIVEARAYLFESEYLKGKSQVLSYITKTLGVLVEDYMVKEKSLEAKLDDALFTQFLSTILLLAVSTTLFLILIFFVLNPIDLFVAAIEKGKKIKLKGSYELRYIQSSYNNLIDKTENRASILKYKAEHDSLTGLINREAFIDIKKILSKIEEPVAYLIIDIDYFKNINDTYGHPEGDKVLKKIADDLMEQFRSTDYVARIGGDEFAVIMTKFGDEPEKIIEKKIRTLNEVLQNVDGDLPSVSLSVGVSISYNGYTKEMEKEADEAMYRVKKGGRCNCSFYTSK